LEKGTRNNGSVATLRPAGIEAEGKEGDDDGEGKEGEEDGESKEGEDNNASATGSSSSGNPHSVASTAQEGKEGEAEGVEFGPVNARLTAAVPTAQKVKPPTIPVTNTTRNSRQSRRAILASKKHGPNTFAASMGENENVDAQPRRVSRKKGKKVKKGKKTEASERINTNNTTAAIYGRELEEEVVSNNESEEGYNGYNTTAAVAPTRAKSKGVGFRTTSTAVNSEGRQSVVATGKK
jgi:hypothetical protein